MKCCSRCLASAANGWLYCVKCGNYIGNDAGKEDIELECENCGITFFGGGFCPYCGTNVEEPNIFLFGENKSDIADIKVGMQVRVGKYPLRHHDELKPVIWAVLDKVEDKVLLISKYALDGHNYNKESDLVPWKDSEIREWLLTKFMDKAFTKEEYARIVTEVEDSMGEVSCDDKVFLLTDEEFCRYIENSEEDSGNSTLACCMPTEYASLRGAKRGGNGTCQWWLRKECTRMWHKSWVNRVGKRERSLNRATKMGVRPAMWISLTPKNVIG